MLLSREGVEGRDYRREFRSGLGGLNIGVGAFDLKYSE